MKALIIFLIMIFSQPSLSTGQHYLSCINGSIQEFGLEVLEINFHADYLNFFFYDKAFTINKSDIDKNENTYTFYKKVDVITETQSFKRTVKASIVLTQDLKTANIKFSMIRGDVKEFKLFCTVKTK